VACQTNHRKTIVAARHNGDTIITPLHDYTLKERNTNETQLPHHCTPKFPNGVWWHVKQTIEKQLFWHDTTKKQLSRPHPLRAEQKQNTIATPLHTQSQQRCFGGVKQNRRQTIVVARRNGNTIITPSHAYALRERNTTKTQLLHHCTPQQPVNRIHTMKTSPTPLQTARHNENTLPRHYTPPIISSQWLHNSYTIAELHLQTKRP